MNADTTQIAAEMVRDRLNVISGLIIGSAQKISSTLGCGFRATGFRICLLLNFGQPRLQVERLVWRF